MSKLLDIKYRADIDGLRAIAILSVIIFHVNPIIFKGGFIGVDIFFVISGYLITSIILKSFVNNKFIFLDFYKRRAKRILPALITVLLFCIIFGWFVLFSIEYLSLGKHVLAGALFYSNILNWHEIEYFSVGIYLKPLVHLWSLGVEEQFYIFWPILLIFIYKKFKKVLSLIFLLFLTSFFLFIIVGSKNADAAYFLPFTRIWELIAGAILSQINFDKEKYKNFFLNKVKSINFPKYKNQISNVASLLGVLIIFISLVLISKDNFYQGWVIFPVIGTFIIILFGEKSFLNKKVLAHKTLVFIGLISYPLYLWHWPLLSFARIIYAQNIPLLFELIIVFISFIFAWLTYEYIEKPIRFKNIFSVRIILLSLSVVVLIASIVVFKKGFDFRFPEQEEQLRNVSIENTLINDIKLCVTLFPLETKNTYMCFASGNNPNKVFIIGDSHTRAVYEGYYKKFEENGYSLISLGISGCHTVISNPKNKKEFDCNEDLKKVIDLVIKNNPKAIIVSNNSFYTKRNNNFEKGMDLIFSYIYDIAPIIWITKTPRPRVDLSWCMDRPLSFRNTGPNCSILKTVDKKMINDQSKAVSNLMQKYPNIQVFDPNSVLCNETECFVKIDNKLLYRDNGYHLSLFGSNFRADNMPIYHILPQIK